VLSKCAVEKHRDDLGKYLRAFTKLANSMLGRQEDSDWFYNRLKTADRKAREAVACNSKWDGKLLDFLTKNATNWDLETIPADMQSWVSEVRDLEVATNSGKWIDLRLLMEPK
jgi:hypothetical protein